MKATNRLGVSGSSNNNRGNGNKSIKCLPLIEQKDRDFFSHRFPDSRHRRTQTQLSRAAADLIVEYGGVEQGEK